MPLPLVPIVIAGATAAIGHYFQKTSAKNQREYQKREAGLERNRQHRKVELKRAEEIFEETSVALSKMYSQLNFFLTLPIFTDPADVKERELLKAKMINAYRDWAEKIPRNMGLVRISFGKKTALNLEKINEALYEIFVQIMFELKMESIMKEDGVLDPEQGGLGKSLDVYSEQINEFITTMLQQIQEENIGNLKG